MKDTEMCNAPDMMLGGRIYQRWIKMGISGKSCSAAATLLLKTGNCLLP